MKTLSLRFLLLFATVALFSCKKENNNGSDTGNYDRKALLTFYADQQIIPAYENMSSKLAELKNAADAFVANANQQQQYTQLAQAYYDAAIAWQHTELFEFGPAEDASLRMYMNIYPVTVSKINANISSGSYDLDMFSNKDAQGFPALDYLIYGVGADATAVAAYYNDAAMGAKRKKYLTDVVKKMQEKTDAVKNGWSGYRSQFVDNAGTDANSGFSKMINAYSLYYERYLRSGKIGLPVGAMTGVAKPELVENYYSPDHSKTFALEALNAVKKCYLGSGASNNSPANSIYTYVKTIGTKDENGKLIADLISEKFDIAGSSLNGLGIIKDDVQNNRAKVLETYQKLQELVPLIKVDMVSALGVSITYTDNDGD